MPGKVLNAFTDENPDLHKHIGCMTGIFQMFDPHHLLTGRRLNRKRLPSGGDAALPDTHLRAEASSPSPQKILEKNLSRSSNENHGVSVESSSASFSSSSCSSSFSSLECNKSTQQEPSFFERTIFPDKSLKRPPTLQSSEIDSGLLPSSPHQCSQNLSAVSGRQSLDFRDVVKDSIHRDTHSLSIKTSNKEETKKHVLKHKDSPRPLPPSETVDRSYSTGKKEKPKMSVDFNKSIQVLAKLKEAPRYFSENRPINLSYEAKEGSFFPVAKESPRFSYDGREISCSSVDSREHNKCFNRLKELPRLSLDSRQSSMSSKFDSKSNSLMRDLESTEAKQKTYRSLTLEQDIDTHRQPTSVVAKLMGLEAMPLSSGMHDHTHLSQKCTINDNSNFHNLEAFSPSSKSLKMPGESKEERRSCSPKSSIRDSAVPRLKPAESVIKPVSNPRIPIETAPWKQDKNKGKTQQMAFGSREDHTRQQHGSVYSEIGRRLKELEFQQSNKDLRALKQILDAIQSKGSLESKRDEASSSEVPYKKSNSNQAVVKVNQNLRTANRLNACTGGPHTTLIKGSNTSRPLEAPIVIMKPAKSINRSSGSASPLIPFDELSGLRKVRTSDANDMKRIPVKNCLTKEQAIKLDLNEPAIRILLSASKNSSRYREENSCQRARVQMAQVSPRLQQPTRENSGGTVRISGSVSPRRQQKKLEVEKKSHPSIPSSESTKSRKQSTTRHISESVSPRGRVRPKSEEVHHSSEKVSEISGNRRNLSNYNDEVSLRTESSVSSASQLYTEVTSAVDDIMSIIKEKKSLKDFSEDASPELSVISLDQPSPVSVLDASLYRDDLPHSPLNRISNSFRGDETPNSNAPTGVIWKTAGPDSHLPNNPNCDLSSTLCHQKLESIENLLQKLRKLSLSDDGESLVTNTHAASLCEMQSPDQQYVSEVVLASGFLGAMPVQLHKSGYAMDPGMFLVLEQTKLGIAEPLSLHESTVRSKCDREKLHRRLLFDTANEILTRKMELAGAGPQHLAVRRPTGQRLLKELCMEIETLQAHGQGSTVGLDDEDDGLKPILCDDMARRSEGWKDPGKEVPGLVLDIERSIFRDLINEVVNGEAAAFVLAKPSRRGRQLFC